MKETGNKYIILVGKPCGIFYLEKLRWRWDSNMKVHVKEIVCGRKCMELA
jgi:hypothetical protein